MIRSYYDDFMIVLKTEVSSLGYNGKTNIPRSRKIAKDPPFGASPIFSGLVNANNGSGFGKYEFCHMLL